MCARKGIQEGPFHGDLDAQIQSGEGGGGATNIGVILRGTKKKLDEEEAHDEDYHG